MIYTDRSRREAAEKCLRKRYWNYEFKDRGIVPRAEGRSRFPLMTGTGVHNAIEHLAMGRTVDEAVRVGVDVYLDFECGEDERLGHLVREQRAIIEGLTRAFALSTLPSFLSTYEVLRVEREYVVELAPSLMWMSRPDFVVRRRSDGSVFIINLKTTKRADERWVAQWPIDQQTLAEVVAVEAAEQEKLSGVIVLGLMKGETLEYPKGSGQWYHNSPLTQAWMKDGVMQARYEWTDIDGSTRRLGKGWKKVPVWEQEGGVKAWVERLWQEDPTLLLEQVVMLPPILRTEYQVEAWKQAVVWQEIAIDARMQLPSDLDSDFPMSTSSGNCLWPVKCPYFSLCHENGDPGDEERWKEREFNHPRENDFGEYVEEAYT